MDGKEALQALGVQTREHEGLSWVAQGVRVQADFTIPIAVSLHYDSLSARIDHIALNRPLEDIRKRRRGNELASTDEAQLFLVAEPTVNDRSATGGKQFEAQDLLAGTQWVMEADRRLARVERDAPKFKLCPVRCDVEDAVACRSESKRTVMQSRCREHGQLPPIDGSRKQPPGLVVGIALAMDHHASGRVEPKVIATTRIQNDCGFASVDRNAADAMSSIDPPRVGEEKPIASTDFRWTKAHVRLVENDHRVGRISR